MSSTSHYHEVRAGQIFAEGAATGLVAAVAVLVPHALLDAVSGAPLSSPRAFAAWMLSGAESATALTSLDLALGTALYLVIAAGVGVVGAAIASVAEAYPGSFYWLASLVAGIVLSAWSVALALGAPGGAALPLWLSVTLGAGTLGAILVARHPGILHHFERISLTPITERDMRRAFDAECTSRGLYRAAGEHSPGDATLAELLALSEKRVQMLEDLFLHFDCEVPADPPPDTAPPFTAEADPHSQALADETRKLEMYDRFLHSIDEPRARHTFHHLYAHATNDAVPALREAATQSRAS